MELKLASRKRRFAAQCLDQFYYTVFFLSILNLLTLVPSFSNLSENYIANSMANESTTLLSVSALIISITLIYNAIYFLKESFRGISPGKYIMGIAVRRKSNLETVPSTFKLFVRNLFLLLWFVEAIASIVSSDKRRVGDIITDSVVLKTGNSKKLLLILTTLPLFIAFFAMLNFSTTTMIKHSDAYKVATEYLYANTILNAQIGEIKSLGETADGQIEIKNGYGKAIITIPVHGTIKDVEAEFVLEKTPDHDWQVMEFIVNSEP